MLHVWRVLEARAGRRRYPISRASHLQGGKGVFRDTTQRNEARSSPFMFTFPSGLLGCRGRPVD